MQIAVNLFYKRIYSTGLTNIPEKDAAIIIANHTSSLMDAAIIGIFSNRPIYFFARGDVFVNRPVRFILKSLHMIPVYHHQKGRDTTNYNEESFERARIILENKGLIVFFPEGSSHTDRKLNPLKKGVFRMAFQTLSSPVFKGNLWMVPAGINYSHATASQAIVMVNVGAPVLLNEFYPSYLTNAAATIRFCAQHFYSILLNYVLHINEDRYQLLADRLVEIQRNTLLQKKSPDAFTAEKACCEKINYSSENANEILEKETSEYFNLLQLHHINDKHLVTNYSGLKWKKFLLLIFSPVLICGYLLNMPPILLAKSIADKKVYRKDFYTWIYVVSSALLYITWLLFLSIFIFVVVGWKWMTAVVIFVLLTGLLVYFTIIWVKEIIGNEKYYKFSQKNPLLVNSLKHCRGNICECAGIPP